MKISHARLLQLGSGNVIRWQTQPHRVCAKQRFDGHRVRIQLIAQDAFGAYPEEDAFWTGPISIALRVEVIDHKSKLQRRRDRDRDRAQVDELRRGAA